MRTRIKICGITNAKDAQYCASLGVDAIGLIFHPDSPRYLRVEQAIQIIESVPAFMTTVGLFMDADAATVSTIIDSARLDCLQFHGEESAEYCHQFGIPYIRAIPMGDMRSGIAMRDSMNQYHRSCGFLFDSHTQNSAGGSGKIFDWTQIPEDIANPVILAGGLNPDNVQSAIHTVKPYAVDCSSGVEYRPGKKSHEKIKQFIEKVNDA